MEEKEASATSNSTSPRGRKAFMLGVVNASEIKCTGDRKRRWDQPPGESEGEEPLAKMPCEEYEDSLLENNVRHDEDPLHSDTLQGTPIPSAQQLDDRLASPSSPSQSLVVKEQIVVQTPSEVLNNLVINSSFPTTITSSFNELNYSEGNQRVTIEIETVAMTPSCDDESKTSIDVINPNSTTVDSISSNEIERSSTNLEMVNCNVETNVENASSPLDSEGCDTMDRASIDVESAGNVDPDIMEVILGISPSKTALQAEYTETKTCIVNPDTGADFIRKENLNIKKEGVQIEIECNQVLTDSVEVNLDKSDKASKSEPHLTKVGSRLKALVDYDDYSDESSQQSDKVLAESSSKNSVEEVPVVCENSIDSKEEEFHDCVEHPTTDESNYDSTSLNFAPIAPETDDLINNNPSDNDGTYSEGSDKNTRLSAQVEGTGVKSSDTFPDKESSTSDNLVKTSRPDAIPESSAITEKESILTDESSINELVHSENIFNENLNPSSIVRDVTISSKPISSEADDVQFDEPCDNISNENISVPDVEHKLRSTENSSDTSYVPKDTLITPDNEEALLSTTLEPTSQIFPSAESHSDSLYSLVKLVSDDVKNSEVDLAQSEKEIKTIDVLSEKTRDFKETSEKVMITLNPKDDSSSVVNVVQSESSSTEDLTGVENSGKVLQTDVDSDRSQFSLDPTEELDNSKHTTPAELKESKEAASLIEPSALPDVITTSHVLVSDQSVEPVNIEVKSTSSKVSSVGNRLSESYASKEEELMLEEISKAQLTSGNIKKSENEEIIRSPVENLSKPLESSEANALPSSTELKAINLEEIPKESKQSLEINRSTFTSSIENESLQLKDQKALIAENSVATNSDDKTKDVEKETLSSTLEADGNVNILVGGAVSSVCVDSSTKPEPVDSLHLNALDESEIFSKSGGNGVLAEQSVNSFDSGAIEKEVCPKKIDETDITSNVSKCEDEELSVMEKEKMSQLLSDKVSDEGILKKPAESDRDIPIKENIAVDEPEPMEIDENTEDNTAGRTDRPSQIKDEMKIGDKVIPEVSENQNESLASQLGMIKDNEVVDKINKSQSLNLADINKDPSEIINVSSEKSSLKLVAPSSAVMTSENNSVLSSFDLNMECESVDTVQSVESEASLLPIKEDVDMMNSNSVIDISSDSTSSMKKDKSALTFDLSKINNSNSKECEITLSKFDRKISAVVSLDDDSFVGLEMKLTAMQEKSIINKNVKPEVILVPDSDSSSSNTEPALNVEKSKKSDNHSFSQVTKDQGSLPSASLDDSVSLKMKSPSRNEVCKIETNKNAVVRKTRSKGSSETQLTVVKKSDSTSLSNSVSSSNINSPEEIKVSNANEEITDEENANSKNEPITLRIFKDNNALHSESRESPKRSRLDDSPKQLEFTLKISKDASTNIPKATMSPKRTQSPQRLPEPSLPRISSEVSITPIVSPPQMEKKTAPKPMRHNKANDASVLDSPVEISLTKVDNINRVSSVVSHVNNISEISKTDLSNCNNVSSISDKSIIEIKDEISIKMESPVNISGRGRRGRRGELHQTPGPPRRRGRPPKRPVPQYPMMLGENYGYDMPGFLSPDSFGIPVTPTDNSTPSRPVRECRDRTRPIIFKTRKPRGAGSQRGRGGRGGARMPALPGREALSAREQEELARIEARNQQILLEKLAKKEAKLAKLAKKAKKSLVPEEPLPPPRELTEEEKIELAAKREAEEKAAAEARAIAAREAAIRAQELAAAKELEKLAKIAARKERLRELHRMKREKILAKKAAKKLKDEERRKRKAAEKAAEQAAALQSMYEDETRMSAPDGSLRPLYGDDTPNRNKTGRMEINLSESKEVSVEQLAEYQWENGELYMIQEQVAEYLGVKSFKRKYPDLKRRPVDAEERKYLEDTCLVPKSLCDLGITAVSSAEVLDIMFQDFPEKYEEVRRYLREKQMKEISSKQRALSLYSKQSDKAKADLREQAMECAATWNAHLNRERREERKCSMDLQSFIIHYPLSKRDVMKQPVAPPGNHPVAVLPGQFCDYFKKYTSNELMYFPLNTVLYGPLKPNERRLFHSDASQSDSESSSSSSESSSSSDDSGSESEGDEDTKCKICSVNRVSRPEEGGGKTLPSPVPNKPEIFLPCTKCKQYCHPSCCNITTVMLPHVRKYNWVCLTCKVCVKCNSGDTQSKMRLCDLCDRGFHITCLDPRKMVPEGNRWHCAICSFCWSCGAREPGGPSNQWLHEFIKDESGEKVYQRSLCAACCAKVGREAAAAVAAAAVAATAQQAGPSGVRLNCTTVTTSGTMTPPVGTQPSSSSSTPTTPVRGYQLPQTKDPSQVRFGNPHVRLALSQTLNSMVVRSSIRGSGPESLVIRSGPRLFSSPDSVVVRSSRGTETQVVLRTPTGVITRPPRQALVISPNNRLETLSPPPSININAATNTPKK